jgi:chitinase
MESNQTDLYAEFTALKAYGIEPWISIGGWAMNDNESVFSALAASTSAQEAFFTSLRSFLDEYGFMGVDIDWWVSPSNQARLALFLPVCCNILKSFSGSILVRRSDTAQPPISRTMLHSSKI